MAKKTASLREFNALSISEAESLIGHIYENSPWTNGALSFKSLEDLQSKLAQTFLSGTYEERLGVLRAHPDLVGKAAMEGKLTESSSSEQKNAGLSLGALTPSEIDFFTVNNNSYKEKFGFPFIICVAFNKKDAIMSAMPKRLLHSADQEFNEACHQVNLIAKVRLGQIVIDGNNKL